MKKRIIASLIVMTMIISLIMLAVNAAETTINLSQDKTSVAPGDTFTITGSGVCDDGINGLTGNIAYDTNQLKLVEYKMVDSKWGDLGQREDGNIEIAIITNEVGITSADIFQVTFEVKDDVEIGTDIKVTFSDLMLDSPLGENSENNIGTKEVSVKVEEQAAEEPGNTTPDNTTPDNTTPDNTTPDNTTPDNTTPGNTTGNTTDNTYEEIPNKNSSQSQEKEMPYTGVNSVIKVAIFGIAVATLISYISYNRYKGI